MTWKLSLRLSSMLAVVLVSFPSLPPKLELRRLLIDWFFHIREGVK